MKYIIEVDDDMDGLLKSNAIYAGMSVEDTVRALLNKYLIDAHIMEKTAMWERGAAECAELELDWANL